MTASSPRCLDPFLRVGPTVSSLPLLGDWTLGKPDFCPPAETVCAQRTGSRPSPAAACLRADYLLFYSLFAL